jgi:predicted RNA-binding protein YlxR (DUF448 family)
MLKITIRTCVVCRKKMAQKLLNRLQCNDKKLTAFTGIGRSFYFCNDCLELENESKLEKALYRNCKNKDKYIVQLREILANGRQS